MSWKLWLCVLVLLPLLAIDAVHHWRVWQVRRSLEPCISGGRDTCKLSDATVTFERGGR